MVEWSWQIKTEALRKKFLYLSHIAHKNSIWSDLGLIPVLAVGGLANRLSRGTPKSPLISVFRSLLSVYRTPQGDQDRSGQTQDSSSAPGVMAVLDTMKD